MLKAERSVGRPSIYTDEIATEICTRLAEGESLRAICRLDHMPHEATVRGWALDERKHPGFYTQFARARQIRAFGWADEMLEIADDATADYAVQVGDGGPKLVVDHEHIQRARLKVDTRKWLVSKMLPKVYGDRLQAELSGPDGGPIETSSVDRIEWAKVLLLKLNESSRELQEGGDNGCDQRAVVHEETSMDARHQASP